MVEISVIIPVYNTEKYLRECLDSIINQTFKDIEIICINDGSTDNSLKILNEYQKLDSRVKIITQNNEGLSSARNTGLDNACGRYIYFIDSDDYLKNSALEKMYTLSEQKKLDLLIFKLMNFDNETLKKDYTYSDMPFLLKINKDTFNYHDFKDNLLEVEVSACTKFFKKELIENKRFPEGLIFEDSLFIFDYIFDAGRIYFLDECLYSRRLRKDSIINDADKKHIDIIKIYDLIYDKFKSKGLYSEYKEKLFMRKVDIIYYRYSSVNQQYKNQFYREMKTSFLKQLDEYENQLNLDEITPYHRNIFESVVYCENDSRIKRLLKKMRLR